MFTKHQQIIQDSRLPLTDYDRVFPYDPRWQPEKCNESRGLLWSESFIEGLSPVAFFVHAILGCNECSQCIQNAIAGREALVECATSTAQSGYSMRLGVKLMESDVVAYDNTIRDGSNRIIQFAYGRTVAFFFDDGAAVRTQRHGGRSTLPCHR